MDISLIIPALNEEESIPELTQWIQKALKDSGLQYEIWFIDDGSTDNTWEVIKKLKGQFSFVNGIKFRRNYGKSAALNTAFEACQGNVVITMDADLQDSPEEIIPLYNMIVKDGFDLVSGWKKVRYDNAITKNIPSKIYNTITGWMSGVKLHDMNCGLKAYKSEVIKSIEVFGEMHRYIPVIAKWAGFRNIGEKVVIHQARKYGKSKFGMSRFLYGFLDLSTILFIGKFGKRPMHFFGVLGVISFFVGFCFIAYLYFTKFAYGHTGMASRPAFHISLMMMIVGSQMFLTGFVAELISRNASERNSYHISDRI
ncbi:MAG TPA: glycosyltransferase family 2 protein [Saprospiraceae bacterium]|jgi:glycosyltransferase involved in cell wall biosynthesis|nr:glycosyltransferase family 2 protein [Saprospiraceae bacterium]